MFKLLKSSNYEKRAKATFFIAPELRTLKISIQKLIQSKFSSKFKIYIIDTGSCNACELEIQSLFNPLYSVAELGWEVVYSIKDADIIFLTGLLTKNMFMELNQGYSWEKASKKMVTIGNCPLGEAVFLNTFSLEWRNENILSAFHIKGCPPEPEEILEGILVYLKGI